MIRLKFLPVVGMALLFSCSGESTPEEGSSEEAASAGHPSIDLEIVKDEFVDCKEGSNAPGDCKTFVSKAICGYYQVDDFLTEDNYIEYDKIYETVEQVGWKKLGKANDQEVLNEALANANNGIATVALEVDGDHSKSVAIITKGEAVKSNGWGLKCPPCAVFFPNRPAKSFTNKTLNYAFSNPEDIVIYSKM